MFQTLGIHIAILEFLIMLKSNEVNELKAAEDITGEQDLTRKYAPEFLLNELHGTQPD